jgi:hypothetical protein
MAILPKKGFRVQGRKKIVPPHPCPLPPWGEGIKDDDK